MPFMKACRGFKKLMKWQAAKMRAAIREDKWFLSESEGDDVGEEKAHFTEEHLNHCAEDWRKEYCSGMCEHREGCELGQAMIERREG